MGRINWLCDIGHVVQECSCCSRCASFTCAVLGLRAASRTSSRRVGILVVQLVSDLDFDRLGGCVRGFMSIPATIITHVAADMCYGK